MRDTDGRKLGRKTQEALRLRAARMLQSGVHPEDIAESLGLNRSTVYGWKSRLEAGGVAALQAKPHPGKPPRLSQAQLSELFALIDGHDPRDYGYAESLWTRDLVADLVEQRFGAVFSAQWMGQLLRRIGLSPQRPKYRASEQDPRAVQAWRQEVYPAIREEAAQVGATVYFGDESGVAANFHAGTTWAPVGKTPIVEATGSKNRINMISAVEQRGRLHFSVFEGSFTQVEFIAFCRKLLADDGGKVFLVLDNSPVHHGGLVAEYVASTEGRLKLFFLPGYSPELNPDEWVWRDVKRDGLGKRAQRTSRYLYQRAGEALQWLADRPENVRRFFLDPHLAYLQPQTPSV